MCKKEDNSELELIFIGSKLYVSILLKKNNSIIRRTLERLNINPEEVLLDTLLVIKGLS